MKTVLLGMNSPTGKVLEYDKANSAGGRLLRLSGMSPVVYNISFKRLNLLNAVEWNDFSARDAAKDLMPKLVVNYRNVVVLGDRVWKALDLPRTEWMDHYESPQGTRFYHIPHTSGRCLWYNDARNSRMVTRLLQKLAKDGGRVGQEAGR